MSDKVKWTELFVPGRVCLLGEHSDWAGIHCTPEHPEVSPGRCLAYGTPCGLYTRTALILEENVQFDDGDENKLAANGAPLVVFHMSSVKSDGTKQETTCPLRLEETKIRTCDGGFFTYVYGTITVLLERYGTYISEKIKALLSKNAVSSFPRRVTVAIDNYRTDLPIGKGLSSSAAACVTVAQCFSALFDLEENTEKIMDIAFCGEIRTGSECGRLDQCVAFGQTCVDLHFRGKDVQASQVQLAPGTTLHFVVADLNAGKDTKKILHELGMCFPNKEKDPVKAEVQEFLGPISLRLVGEAVKAIRHGNAEALGAAFTEYQQLFDKHLIPACSELKAPRLHEVLHNADVQKLTFGGKGVGSQGDGSVQFICRSETDQTKLVNVLETQLNCRCILLSLRG